MAIIRIELCETLIMILAIRSHESELLETYSQTFVGLYFFVSVGFLACFVICCNILAISLSYNL